MVESPATRDLEQLLENAIDRARAALDEEGAFMPFALAIDSDREPGGDDLALLEAGIDEEADDDVELDEQAAFEALLSALRESGEAFRAVAIVFDSVIDDEWDGVTVQLAHRDATPMDAVLPYRVSGRKRVFAELERAPGELEVWT